MPYGDCAEWAAVAARLQGGGKEAIDDALARFDAKWQPGDRVQLNIAL